MSGALYSNSLLKDDHSESEYTTSQKLIQGVQQTFEGKFFLLVGELELVLDRCIFDALFVDNLGCSLRISKLFLKLRPPPHYAKLLRRERSRLYHRAILFRWLLRYLLLGYLACLFESTNQGYLHSLDSAHHFRSGRCKGKDRWLHDWLCIRYENQSLGLGERHWRLLNHRWGTFLIHNKLRRVYGGHV